MLAQETQPPTAPQGPDWLTIAQLAVSGLGMVFSLLAAGLLVIFGLVAQFSETSSPANVHAVFSMAWISLLVGVLAIPSVVFSIQRLRNRVSPQQTAWKPFRLASLLLIVWPAVLLLGNLVSGQAAIRWLLLPPLQLLAAGIPAWWLLEMARRNLSTGSRQRGWGLVSFSIFLTTPALMFIEILGMVLLVIAFAVWAGLHPELVAQLQELMQRMLTERANPELMLRMLLPYLQNPWVIFSALALTAGLVPLVEELVKPLGVWLLAGRRLTPAQGFVAGALCGASFALIESLFYLSNAPGGGWAMLAAGRAGTILLHITTAAIVGRAMALAWRDRTYLRLFLSYLGAAALHGTWNGLAVLTGFSAVLENPPANLRVLYEITKIAPFGVILLAVVLFFLLVGINRQLNRQPEPATAAASLAADPHKPVA